MSRSFKPPRLPDYIEDLENPDTDDISIDEEMDQINTVLDAYAREVGILRASMRAVEKNIANIESRLVSLEKERAAYEASVYVPDTSAE